MVSWLLNMRVERGKENEKMETLDGSGDRIQFSGGGLC